MFVSSLTAAQHFHQRIEDLAPAAERRLPLLGSQGLLPIVLTLFAHRIDRCGRSPKPAAVSAKRRPSTRTVQKLTVAIDELAVRIDLAAGAEVADQIPVERRAVEAARLRIRGSERKVHRPADLLVEEGVAGEHRHGLVQAEREFPDSPGPIVHRNHLAQELLAAGRRGLDHLARFEAKPDVIDLARVEDPGIREPDLTFDARLEGSREDLPVGEVLLTLGGNPGPA